MIKLLFLICITYIQCFTYIDYDPALNENCYNMGFRSDTGMDSSFQDNFMCYNPPDKPGEYGIATCTDPTGPPYTGVDYVVTEKVDCPRYFFNLYPTECWDNNCVNGAQACCETIYHHRSGGMVDFFDLGSMLYPYNIPLWVIQGICIAIWISIFAIPICCVCCYGGCILLALSPCFLCICGCGLGSIGCCKALCPTKQKKKDVVLKDVSQNQQRRGRQRGRSNNVGDGGGVVQQQTQVRYVVVPPTQLSPGQHRPIVMNQPLINQNVNAKQNPNVQNNISLQPLQISQVPMVQQQLQSGVNYNNANVQMNVQKRVVVQNSPIVENVNKSQSSNVIEDVVDEVKNVVEEPTKVLLNVKEDIIEGAEDLMDDDDE